MGESGRKTVLVRFRALPGEAESLRARAAAQGCTLSELLLRLAAEAGWIAERSTYGAPVTGAPEHHPAPDARLTALERRVEALEAVQRTQVTPDPPKAPRRALRGPSAGGTAKAGREYADDDPRRAVRASDLPPGFPATGAELATWRERLGLSGEAFAKAVKGVSRQTVTNQTKKAGGPLSVGFARKLVAAVEAGRLPAP